jgi:hypothetical protein
VVVLLYLVTVVICLAKRGAVYIGAFTIATLAMAAWLLFFGLSLSDYHDADGWIDCGSCTTLQKATGRTLAGGMAILCVVLMSVVIGALSGQIATRRRSR